MGAKDEFIVSKIRNLGIIAHIDAGKTTTSEHLLYYSGVTHRLGGVDEGTTDTDYDAEEQERGITIYSACIPFTWQDHTINLIDTPGHVDFTAEVERSLRVLDGAVVVFDAQKGVEAQSETVWRQANKYKVPRLVFINKMDVVGANYSEALDAVVERLEGNPVPLVIPIGAGSIKDSSRPFEGVIDLLEMKALYFDKSDEGKTFREEPIPEDMKDEAQNWRERMLDGLTEHDEEDLITTACLEGEEVLIETFRHLIRQETLRGVIHPVFCGSGREHAGIQPLMDAVCWYLPSPLESPPVEGTLPGKPDKKEIRKPDDKEPFSGLVFKMVADKHNEIFFLRIYSGQLKPQSRPFNPGKECKELVSKIYHTHADPRKREELKLGHAGDIVALLGLKDSVTGDTLCDQHHPVLLEPIQFAKAVVSKSIEPETSADRDKLIDRLNLLAREDPTFTWHESDSGQTLMNGMGVLHLEIKQHRLERDFGLKVRVGKPRVSYRERVRQKRRAEGECARHPGTNQFAKVTVQVEPTPDNPGIEVLNQIDYEKIPVEYVDAAREGAETTLQSGDLGYPLMGVRAVLLDAEMDESLSTETAFLSAGSNAIHKALADNLVLMEPIMKLEVTVPDEFLGTVTSDLSLRRGEVDKIESRGKIGVIEARVPLATMFDYAERLRSLTQGRGASTLEPYSYEPAPDSVLQALLNPDYA